MFDRILDYLITVVPTALGFSVGVIFARVFPHSDWIEAIYIYGPMWAAADYYAWRKRNK